ncbi:MAG: glycosyltransferase family 4 protein [Lachnospiraceae bacterium]|nr:glycosyltransferase family 4 protein [Lachnospiraceae bacterium]
MEQLVFVTLSLTKGGAERVICNMCNEYFAERYRVTIISLMKAEPEYRLDERIRLLTVDEEVQGAAESLPVRFLRRRKKLKTLLRGLKKEGAQVIISFLPEPNMLTCSLKRAVKMRLIISVRNAPSVEYRGKVRYLLMRLLYPKADAYVFQTKQAKEYFSFSDHITKNSTVIPNPIARGFIGCPASQNRKKEIVAVGRLEEQKDPVLLLEAFAQVHGQFPEYRLLLYGEGSLKEKLLDEIRRYGLEDAAFLKGNAERIEELIKDASLFVLSSRYEGMPNALMEAMAMGVPCVAADCPCGGPAELIRHGENGLLVPVGDKEKLAEAMAAMLRDSGRAQQMGIRAQEIGERLKPEAIYEKWEQLVSAGRQQ